MAQVVERRDAKPSQALKDVNFNWQDPLDLEGELTEEERMVRDTARSFAQTRLMPQVKLAFREERFDRGIITEMGKLGLLEPVDEESEVHFMPAIGGG